MQKMRQIVYPLIPSQFAQLLLIPAYADWQIPKLDVTGSIPVSRSIGSEHLTCAVRKFAGAR
jgi:hypothetical protein